MNAQPDPASECDLSVIIPVRNERGQISGQLDALVAQEWGGSWEIVVVDNGSTDGTPDVVRDYAARDPRIRLAHADARASSSYTRNVGVGAARGHSLAFCDADDLVAPGWVAAIGDALRVHEYVTGLLELDRLNPAWLAGSRGRGDERGLPSFYGSFPFAHGNNFGIRRTAFERAGGFDEQFPHGSEDVEFSFRAWRAGVSLHFEPRAVVHYRYRDVPKHLWRQGFNYGRGRPLIRRRMQEARLPAPAPFAGWKSWCWLLANAPRLVSSRGRAAWLWVAGARWGHVVGSVRYRCLFL